MAHGYLQHARDWAITREAIIRLAARLGRPFTYGELNAELDEHDNLRIDGRGYAGALEAGAQKTKRSEPLWTAMVINADTGKPGDGLWKANPDDRRYADAGTLSEPRRWSGWEHNERGVSRPHESSMIRSIARSATKKAKLENVPTRYSSTC